MAIKKGKDVKEKKVKKTKEKPEKNGKKAKAEKEPKVKKGKKGRVIDGDTGEVIDDAEGIALRAHNASEDMDAMLDAIEKDVGIVAVTAGSRNTTSTGLLSLDLMLCGGLVSGGWYTFFGGEQSSKSTLAMTQIARAAMQGKIPILLYFDFEGSLSESLDYMLSIAKAQGFKGNLQDLFGIQDPKTGKYIRKPLIRRYQESVAERFFDLVAKLERSLPDKLYRNEKWWFVYEHTKVNISKYSAKADKQLYKQTGKLWVETDNGHPQAMIVVDSYPAMLPERLDEDDVGAGMAAQARMFSDNIKRVKGKMSSKRIIIMGVNQLRKAPMVKYGSPEYEPGGEAVKFFSDVRIRMASRSVLGGTGQLEEEPSVEKSGGKDVYRYVNMRAAKNKLSVPNLEGWARIWVRDAKGKGRGYDPVFDTFTFLKELKLISGTKKNLSIKLKEFEGSKGLTWAQFKMLCIGEKQMVLQVFKEAKIKGKPFKLRERLFKMVASGKATEQYFAALAAGGGKDKDEEVPSDE